MPLGSDEHGGREISRTAVRLADGRELIFFDESRRDRSTCRDRRDLGERLPAAELRHDPLLDEWVAVASHRQDRTHLPTEETCPLCPTTPTHATEIPASDYDVVVFENRFPSYGSRGHTRGATGTGRQSPGPGRCEVVCFSSDHVASMATLTRRRVRTVVDAWVDRTRQLSARHDVEYVFCFENRGDEIGVTLHHPHGQIYAYPFVPPKAARIVDTARRHHEATGDDLPDTIVANERSDGRRILAESEHWLAFVPYFSRWPFEVHVYPRRRVADLPSLTSFEREDFAAMYLDVLGRFDRLFGRPLPYISAWHQAPVREGREFGWLWLQLFSIRRSREKLKYLAGSESAMGAFVTDVEPEQAAQLLRGVAR